MTFLFRFRLAIRFFLRTELLCVKFEQIQITVFDELKSLVPFFGQLSEGLFGFLKLFLVGSRSFLVPLFGICCGFIDRGKVGFTQLSLELGQCTVKFRKVLLAHFDVGFGFGFGEYALFYVFVRSEPGCR